MSDVRTSIEFTDVSLVTLDPIAGGDLITGPETEAPPQNIVPFVVDNGVGVSPTTTEFSAEVFTQSEVSASTSKSFSSDFHWDVSMTETFSEAESMFPNVSFSSTQSLGGSSSSSSSQTSSNSLPKGVTQTYRFTHQTPANTVGDYSIMADSGTVAIGFRSNVMLVFGIKIHGFLRWGGGKPFVGDQLPHPVQRKRRPTRRRRHLRRQGRQRKAYAVLGSAQRAGVTKRRPLGLERHVPAASVQQV